MKHISISLILAFIAAGCSQSATDKAIEDCLAIAGGNRPELELVLVHYRSGGDEEKSMAAEFLIANMPGHFSYADNSILPRYYQAVDSVLENMKDMPSKTICDSINSLASRLDFSDLKIVEDATVISSDFLIDNIDTAFEQWRHGQWAKHLTFDEFCEYLLPYKAYELQPLEKWRPMFKRVNNYHLKHLEACDMLSGSSFRAADFMFRYIQEKFHPEITAYGLDVPVLDPRIAVKMPFGRCNDYSAVGAAVYRSVGLPIMIDDTPTKGNENVGHVWNVLRASDGKNIVFNAMTDSPTQQHMHDSRLAKAWRTTYAVNPELNELIHAGEFVPGVFRSIHKQDVTAEHTKCADITVIAPEPDNRYLYLAVSFSDTWMPVDFAKLSGGKAMFDNVGLNCVYMPVCYSRDGEMQQAGYPFLLDFNGETHQFKPDTTTTVTAVVKRKYPIREYAHHTARKMEGGRLEASDNADFSNPITVHTIVHANGFTHDITVPDAIGARRYWRYVQDYAPDSHCNIAELSFLDNQGNKLTGNIIGTPGTSTDNPDATKEKAFDNNPLTYFDAPLPTGAWVGMDFGQPQQIKTVRFTPRGDGNNIEPGDTYELFYCGRNGWMSLGRRTADTITVTYHNVPANALLLLIDRTKGHEHRIFTIESRHQKFH